MPCSTSKLWLPSHAPRFTHHPTAPHDPRTTPSLEISLRISCASHWLCGRPSPLQPRIRHRDCISGVCLSCTNRAAHATLHCTSDAITNVCTCISMEKRASSQYIVCALPPSPSLLNSHAELALVFFSHQLSITTPPSARQVLSSGATSYCLLT